MDMAAVPVTMLGTAVALAAARLTVLTESPCAVAAVLTTMTNMTSSRNRLRVWEVAVAADVETACEWLAAGGILL